MVKAKIIDFLEKIDKDFPIPLSSKTDFESLAYKFEKDGVICVKEKNNEIIAMVAGYMNDRERGVAYVSVVGTLKAYRGKVYAAELIEQFKKKADENSMKKIKLYTHATNSAAIKMYEKLGFYQVLSDRKGDV